MSSETARSTPVDKRRAQAVAGALAGLVVVIVLFAVFFGVKAGKSDNSAKSGVVPSAAAQPSDGAPSTDPSAADPGATAAQPATVDTPAALSKEPVVKAGTGTLKKVTITPIVKGTGPAVKAGQTITVNYVVVTYKDGKTVDSSWTRGQPLSTQIGVGKLIKGFDQAIPGQRVGSRVQIDIPADLAYGAQQGDLRFVVDILAAQ
jgi:peptidylprolyl isomerase